MADGLSSDFSEGALPRVNGGTEAPGGGPKNDVCLLAAALVASEADGGANVSIGVFDSV